MPLTVTVAGQQVKVEENLLDRAIRWAAPAAANRRLLQRAAYAVAGGYTGGRRDKRSLSAWKTVGNSADADLLPDLPTLRERSRDLVRNEPLAAGAINTATTHVVGTGLMLKSRVKADVLGWEPEQAAEWQKNTEREWCMHADSTDIDAARTLNFYGLQDLAFRSVLENGDALALLPYLNGRSSPYRLAVQLIEADRVCNKDSAPDTPGLAGGVQLDANGAPLAYHVMTQHPGDRMVIKREWRIYPAFGSRTGRRNVLHLYRKLRIGQNRGIPYFAPVIEAFKQIGRYSEAEIFAAVATAMFAIETKTEDRNGLSPLESAVSGATPTSADAPKESSWDGTLTPGLTVDLGLNESLTGFNPNRPNANFDPFVQAVLRQVGVALEIPFELLIKHFTASYSAARAALLEMWRFVRVRRAWLADTFCTPVYAAWLEEAVALGRIQAPGFFDDPMMRAAYLGCTWHGDGPGSINPKDEAMAQEIRLRNNITTLAEEIAEYNGGDAFDTIRQKGIEREALEEHDLLPEPAVSGTAMPAGSDPEDPEQPDQGDQPGDGTDPASPDNADPADPADPMDSTDAIVRAALARPTETHIHMERASGGWVFEQLPDGTTRATPVQPDSARH